MGTESFDEYNKGRRSTDRLVSRLEIKLDDLSDKLTEVLLLASENSTITKQQVININEVESRLISSIESHTHSVAPHAVSIGNRLTSLENSRTYTKGVLAVGAIVMPFVSALIFKWIGGS